MILLETTQDNTGEILEIYFSKLLRNTPAMVELLKANVEVLELGLAGAPKLLVHDDDQVVWAQTQEGHVRSSAAFSVKPEEQTATLTLSYTDPACRGRGIRSLLQKHIDTACANQGVMSIISIIHIKNASSNAMATKQEYIPHSTIYYKKIAKVN